jgi:vacuolar-type H+-ATPase subunit I/STV1
MSNLNGKLAPAFVWLFALATVGVALLVTKLIPGPISPKAMAAVYFVIFGAFATAGMFLTRAGVGASIGAFALAGASLGIFYYVVIAGSAPGSSLGQGLGLIFGVAFGVDAFAAGVAGTLFGAKLRKNLRPATA